jgi:two-component system, LytTR family, sensor kinase
LKHPILNSTAYKHYILLWGVLALIYTLILIELDGMDVVVAAMDSLLLHLIFAGIGIGLWYVVQYASIDDNSLLSTLVMHAVAAALTIFIWVSASRFLVFFIFSNSASYQLFLDQNLVWRVIMGVIYYCLIILSFYLIKYYLEIKERSNQELELQGMVKDAELRMIKSQINPHFIFNSLNSVSALTISKPEAAREMVIKLSEFLRYSIGKDNVEMNTLAQEIQNASLYLDIEKVRFGNKLQVEMNFSEACAQIKVPNLILQPLLENAIKYGVYESTEPVEIHLSCEKREDLLIINLTNTFDSEAIMPKGTGIGLPNIRKRLELIYDRNDLLEVDQHQGTFMVKLKIPVH